MEDLNLTILKETKKQLSKELKNDYDIIFIDRSINERLIWNHRRYIKNDMKKSTYYQTLNKYSKFARKNVDILVIGMIDNITSLKRDYCNTLALEKRTFLNKENIAEYNYSMNKMIHSFTNNVSSVVLLDTICMNQFESSLYVDNKIIEEIRIKQIKNVNNLLN